LTEFIFGAIDGLGHSLGKYAIMTMDVPWNLVKKRIGALPIVVTMVRPPLERRYLDHLVAETPVVDAVVGIGGGVAVDAAKYLAWKRACPLVLVPTALSVDAYVTPAAGVREDGIVKYVGNATAGKVIIDYEAIQSAPKRLNTAGTGDVYSCRTALYDWKLSHEKTGESYDSGIASQAQRALDTLLKNASEIEQVSEEGIRVLVSLHREVNRLQLTAGTPRPEEGSEHTFFYALEEVTHRSFLHGEVVGTGIYVASHFQSGDADDVASDMDRLGLMFRPRNYGITREEFVAAVLDMKNYSKRAGLPFSIVNIADITRDETERLWRRLAS